MAVVTQKELYRLRQELRNKTKLHAGARTRVKQLEATVKAQKEEIKVLHTRLEEQNSLILEFKRQLEELRTKIFKKRTKKTGVDDDTSDEVVPPDTLTPQPRRHARRPIPPPESITERHEYALTSALCTHCASPLSSYQTVEYYAEDIILPHEQQLTTATETTIQRGWCAPCGRWSYAHAPPSSSVCLGPQLKAYMCYLSILLRLSYAQIRLHLVTSYHITVSDGEISHILTKEAVRLRLEYEAIDQRINRHKGIHEDETSWPVQAGARGNHAWVKTGTDTPEAIFRFGESRGKGVAEKLTGTYTGVGITDDYAAYHSIFKGRHQLCWAHPHRKLRDLARSDVFDEGTKEHCKDAYHTFSDIYALLRETLEKPWESARNRHVRETILNQLYSFSQPNSLDPRALQKIRARLMKTAEKYVTCLLYEGIPADNNKAERSLRHMVIKRKTSFGSRTQKGAEVLSVLASVVLSLYWTRPETFFEKLLGIGVEGV